MKISASVFRSMKSLTKEFIPNQIFLIIFFKLLNLSVAVAATGFDFNHCFKKHKPMTFTSGNFECAHCGYRMERMRANFKAGHARYL